MSRSEADERLSWASPSPNTISDGGCLWDHLFTLLPARPLTLNLVIPKMALDS